MRYNKRGQFYLIAAVVIIGVLIGLAVVTNFVIERKAYDKFIDIHDELRLESENIINHGVFDDDDDVAILLENFAEQYAQYIGEENDVLFVYGDEETLSANASRASGETGPYVHWVSLFSVQSSVSLVIGGRNLPIEVNTAGIETDTLSLGVGDEDFIISVGDTNYEFELTEGKNFFFVIRQPGDGGDGRDGGGVEPPEPDTCDDDSDCGGFGPCNDGDIHRIDNKCDTERGICVDVEVQEGCVS